MKFVIIIGTFFEFCSLFLMYTFVKEEILIKLELSFVKFIRNFFVFVLIGIHCIYGFGHYIFSTKYNSETYLSYLNPFNDGSIINFPFEAIDTFFIAHCFILLGFISQLIAGKILSQNSVFFIRDIVEEKINIVINNQKKNKKSKNRNKGVANNSDKIQQTQMEELYNKITKSLLGALPYMSQIFSIPYFFLMYKKFISIEHFNYNHIIWVLFSLILFFSVFYLGLFFPNREQQPTNIKSRILITFLVLSIQGTSIIYFFLAQLHLTWNVLMLMFSLYTFFLAFGSFTSLIVEYYSKMEELKNIKQRVSLMSFFLGLTGVGMQLIGSMF